MHEVHVHGDPVTLCTFRDARRTCRAQCPSTKVTLCIAPSLLQHLPSLMVHHLHLWCTSCDVLGTVSCMPRGSSCCCPCCDLHGRGRVGCSGIRYHIWSCTCCDILGTTSCDVRGSFSCCTRYDLHGRGAAPAVIYGAPALTYFLSSTCAACSNLHGRSRISRSCTCRDIRGSACCDLSRSSCRHLFAATTSGPNGHVHGCCSGCSCACFHGLGRAAGLTCRDLHG